MNKSTESLARRTKWVRHTLVAAGLASAVGFSALVGPSAPAEAAPAQGYYSVPYSDTLYYHFEYAGSAGTYPATYSQWVGDGSPQPKPVTTDFVKYPWSPTIYAVSYFDGGWVWSGPLAFQQWQKAGFPSPRNAGFIDGTTYHKWDTSGELFAKAPDNTTHKLTYSEWAASNFQEPRYEVNRGYQKLAWDGHIGYIYAINTGDGYPIDYSEWAAAGFPTPQAVARFPGDIICQYTWGPGIFYYGPTFAGQLTYSQWAAAGYPPPTHC